jgi:DNA processing protein
VAALIESTDDLEYILNWEKDSSKPEAIQQQLFINLSDEETTVYELLKNKGAQFIDQICSDLKIPMSKVSSLLLNLEFKGAIRALPGKMYKVK